MNISNPKDTNFDPRIRKYEELTVTYITSLKNLARTCKFNEYSGDQAVVDQCIDRSSSQILRRQLLREKIKSTLSHVVQLAGNKINVHRF